MKILSCGAGQQSTALALMSCDNKLYPNKFPLVPIYDVILFCDMGKEPPWVYDQVYFIKKVCEEVGIPFYILDSKNLYEDYINNFGKKRVVTIPFWSVDESGKKGKMTRHCTIDYKIIQMQNFVRWNLLGYKKGERTRNEDIQAHEMHIGFTSEESRRIFDSKHKLFINKFPMCEMGLVRADNYAYVKEEWGLETKGSACQHCPFHSNYFFKYLKDNHPIEYEDLIMFDNMLGHAEPNSKIGVPNSKIYISKSRKRISALTCDECKDIETFRYNEKEVWNGF